MRLLGTKAFWFPLTSIAFFSLYASQWEPKPTFFKISSFVVCRRNNNNFKLLPKVQIKFSFYLVAKATFLIFFSIVFEVFHPIFIFDFISALFELTKSFL